ncbi:hypothetical protein SADUNF_Sadunf18G0103400 [Salix dunnii]|uniref:Uncharacterized protein n=1 Tax=Salix dunnii TaxID=1413687 RepID=A0A835J704_9ROSI|nr:hypothetical protein SADUNF_Sadunf18G0103400 [Salix dunnii]
MASSLCPSHLPSSTMNSPKDETPSSIDAVVANGDLVTAILLRVPANPMGIGFSFFHENECLQTIPRPPLPENQNFRYFGESGCYLHFIGLLAGNQNPDDLKVAFISSNTFYNLHMNAIVNFNGFPNSINIFRAGSWGSAACKCACSLSKLQDDVQMCGCRDVD